MHTVRETHVYARAADAAGLTDDERLDIMRIVGSNPTLGVVIPSTGGARKFRYAARGKGKSSGYRIITYFAADDVPVFLMDVYAKGERINLTQAEKNALKDVLSTVADDYRASVKEKVIQLRKVAS